MKTTKNVIPDSHVIIGRNCVKTLLFDKLNKSVIIHQIGDTRRAVRKQVGHLTYDRKWTSRQKGH